MGRGSARPSLTKFSLPNSPVLSCQASTLDPGVHLLLNIKVGASSSNLLVPLKRYAILYSFVSMLNSVIKRLVLADAKIQQLTMENRRLRQFIVNGNLDKPAANSTLSKVNNYKNQQTNTRPTSTLLEMKDSLSDSTRSNSSLTQGLQDITNTFGANPFADENSSVSAS